MFDQLFKSIQEKVALSEAERELCKTYFVSKKVLKKEMLQVSGGICQYNIFVEKGVLRSFYVDEKGNEHTIQFAVEGWWITDLASFLTQSTSIYTIQALEDSEVLLLTSATREALMEQVPLFERYQRLLLQNAYVANQERINSVLTASVEEKYVQLLHRYPNIVQRVPQHMIASYLGCTPATLSRVRRKISN